MVLVPEGIVVEVSADENKVIVRGPKGLLEKKFDAKTISVKVEGSEVKIEARKKETRRVLAVKKAFEAHLKNMFDGVRGDFQKKLVAVYSHFPITLETKGGEVLIKNFLGEKIPRRAKIVGETKVSVSGTEVIVSGRNKEEVGQTASNLVKATKVTARDERVFQDGLYYA